MKRWNISASDEAALDRYDELITAALVRCTEAGTLLYALDRQHSGFLFDPRDEAQMRSVYV